MNKKNQENQNNENKTPDFKEFKLTPEEAKNAKGGIMESFEEADGKKCYRCEGRPEWTTKKDCIANGGVYTEIPCPTA